MNRRRRLHNNPTTTKPVNQFDSAAGFLQFVVETTIYLHRRRHLATQHLWSVLLKEESVDIVKEGREDWGEGRCLNDWKKRDVIVHWFVLHILLALIMFE